MATDTRAEPKTLPITVGIVEKNPPLAAPLITTKTASGAKVIEAGHSASMLTAVRVSEINKVFSAPSLSHIKPHIMRPTAEEKLKPARRPAPVLEDSPIERL